MINKFEDIPNLAQTFKEANKAVLRYTAAFEGIKNELDIILAAHNTRRFTRTIFVTVFILIILTLLVR